MKSTPFVCSPHILRSIKINFDFKPKLSVTNGENTHEYSVIDKIKETKKK